MTPAVPLPDPSGSADGTQPTGTRPQGEAEPTAPAGTGWRATHPDLRPASLDDYPFIERLYVATMQPLLERLDAWDEDDVLTKFKDSFRPEEAWIVRTGGIDAGWLQVAESEEALTLMQLHLVPEARERGIGTGLIRRLMAEATDKGKPVLLSVVRNNRALGLYRRLGFEVVGEDATKLHMAWTPPPDEQQRSRRQRPEKA